MRRSSPRRLRTQPQPSMPLSTITAASASSHSTHRAAPQPFYGRQTAVSPCVEGAPRWSPTPTRGPTPREQRCRPRTTRNRCARSAASSSRPRRSRWSCARHLERLTSKRHRTNTEAVLRPPSTSNPAVVPHRSRRPPGRVRRERHDPRLTPLRRERLSGPWTGPDGAPWMTPLIFRIVPAESGDWNSKRAFMRSWPRQTGTRDYWQPGVWDRAQCVTGHWRVHHKKFECSS